MWVFLAVLSAICLGFYDISKKRSLEGNSVIGVLTTSIWISSAILGTMLFLSRIMPANMQDTLFFVPKVDLRAHLFIFLKSCIVLSSWIFAYVAIKHLPLSVVSPMQATRPMWTLIGALFIFGEVLNKYQWIGVIFAIGSIFIFSFVQKGNSKTNENKVYYIALILAILHGAGSGLYDKYMMRNFDHNAVQVYYTFYQALMMTIVALFDYFFKARKAPKQSVTTFTWRWEIAAISVLLVLSDFVYLLALSYPDSLIAVVSTIRRSGTIIPFLYGLIILREKDPIKKILCLSGIAIGLLFLLLGS